MANYSFIGYAPSAISFLRGGTLSVAAGYDFQTDRRVFNVEDDATGTILGSGAPDDGVTFHGDRFNNEVGDDLTQTGEATSLDGSTVIESGNIYLEQQFNLTPQGGGASITLYQVEIDGVLVGYIPSTPLDPDEIYDFTTSNVTPVNAPDTSAGELEDVPCFVAGTWIKTPIGDVLIDDIQPGDLVLNSSGGAVPVLWVGQKTVLPVFASRHDLWPIRIAKGALGEGLPTADLCVSPNHRVVVRGPAVDLLIGETESLIPAKFLTRLPGVMRERNLSSVTYFHLLFDTHQIVLSNGTPSESLHPGEVAMNSLHDALRREILAIFPELDRSRLQYGPTARQVLNRREAALVVQSLAA